jgi:K+/H+ antiporter YhaU regulatory subunit KhtT
MEAKASVELFNDRMNFIDQTYSLQEKELEHVVAEMKGIDNTSESFEALKDKLAVVFSHRNKEAIAKAEQEVQERVEELVASTLESAKKVESEVSEASVEDEDLQTTDEETSTIPNNTAEASTETSLVEKLKNNFQVQITK